MNKVVDLKIKKGYRVNVTFSDSFDVEVDLKPFLGKGIAEELLEEQKFNTLHIESGGGIAWENGYDICPNQLRKKLKVRLFDDEFKMGYTEILEAIHNF